jgi:hypothetical protein
MMLQQPQDLTDWVAFLGQTDIPVLRHTARELERLRADEEHLNARSIADVVTDDPLMTVKLLRYLQTHKHRSQTQELVQVEQAIIMMGFDTFFREIPLNPIAEAMLHDHLDALVHLLQAVRLHDLHAEEVRVSALLTYVAEMLMWCFNPEQMLEIRKRQDADKRLRSADVQKQVLGFKGINLQRELAAEWRLPALLLNLMDPALAKTVRVQTVMLAVNLARHSALGWDDAALPDDYRAIAALLRTEPDKVMALVGADRAANA